ncbi:hypothetical protein [Laceyella putida]|uniref:Uncharacterized protein n=1 Tax=Laceyella putida TaxID=110101 RepID=A0ABW2RR61_9BACL
MRERIWTKLSELRELKGFFILKVVFFIVALLSGSVSFYKMDSLNDLWPELAGISIDILVVIFFYETIRKRDEERKMAEQKEEQEKELMQELISRNYQRLVEKIAITFVSFFASHIYNQRDIIRRRSYSEKIIEKQILPTLDGIIDQREYDFTPVLRREKDIPDSLLIDQRHCLNPEKKVYSIPDFDTKFRIPVRRYLNDFLKMYLSILPEEPKKALLRLNDSLLKFDDLIVQMGFWIPDDVEDDMEYLRKQKKISEEERKKLKGNIEDIAYKILDLFQYQETFTKKH